MTKTENTAAVAAYETELLLLLEQQQVTTEDTSVAPTQSPARPHLGVRTSPFARLERSTICRTKRLGPAFSLSTMRRIYPDEDSAIAA